MRLTKDLVFLPSWSGQLPKTDLAFDWRLLRVSVKFQPFQKEECGFIDTPLYCCLNWRIFVGGRYFQYFRRAVNTRNELAVHFLIPSCPSFLWRQVRRSKVQFFWSEAFLSTAIYSYLYYIKILNENENILSLIKFLLNCKRFWAVPKFNSIICKKFQFSGQKRCNFVDAFPKANVGENLAYKWINL